MYFNRGLGFDPNTAYGNVGGTVATKANSIPSRTNKRTAAFTEGLRAMQAEWLSAKLRTLPNALDFSYPDDSTTPPPSAQALIITTPFPNQGTYVAYPAPGAAAVQILQDVVPSGWDTFYWWLSIFHIGGGFVDGSGNVIWRVFVNNAAHKGLGNIQSQIGTSLNPAPGFPIHLVQNDILTVTVEVPAGQNPMPAGALTGCRLQGWRFPAGQSWDSRSNSRRRNMRGF